MNDSLVGRLFANLVVTCASPHFRAKLGNVNYRT